MMSAATRIEVFHFPHKIQLQNFEGIEANLDSSMSYLESLVKANLQARKYKSPKRIQELK
jgi:hypothetical protein